MNQSWSKERIWVGLFSVLAINSAILTTNCALAQIVPDNTLGSESSTIRLSSQLPVEIIEGGATRGSNLFHSLSEFNVSEGRGVYFNSPSADIQNILTRVTGSNPSTILGTIGTFGNSIPNLFLINPNGIVFGPSASLDIGNSGLEVGGTGGSFVATTANAILLGNSGIFSASNPAASNLLTVNPSALFFNGTSPAEIVNRATSSTSAVGGPTLGLAVPSGRSLLLVGDNVRADGGEIISLGGRVELGGVTAGTVGLNLDGNNLSLDYPAQVQRADIVLTNKSRVFVSGGGSIAVNARNIDILEESVLSGSLLSRSILPAQSSADAQAGDITLNATGNITIAGRDNSFSSPSAIFNTLLPGAVGQGGNINITADSLSLNGAALSSISRGQGNVGSIFIQAKNSASFVDSRILSEVRGEAVGKAGDISIQSLSIFANNSTLSTTTSSRGDAGNISIQAGSLFLDNSALSTNTLGVGDAGSVFIRTSGLVSLTGDSSISSGVFSSSLLDDVNAVISQAAGNGGDINIEAGALTVDESSLGTSTFGLGNAGNVFIRTSGLTSFTEDSFILSSVGNSVIVGDIFSPNVVVQGKSGDITIYSDSLMLDDSVLIGTVTSGQGDAGAIFLQANNISLFKNSVISSAVQPTGVGDAGNIDIRARSLSLTGGSQIRASVQRSRDGLPGGQGAGGNIQINASDTVELSGVSADGGSSALTTNTGRGASGRAGNITVNTTDFRIADGAVVSALTANSSNAGNITINASNFEASGGGQVLTSTSSSGSAGSITLNVTDKIALTGGDPTFVNRLAQFGSDIVTNQGAASGLFANTAPSSTGAGGSIFIDPIQFSITDGARVSVASLGQGNGGNLQIQARNLTLDRDGGIEATTASGEGGNITIRVQDLLLLRRNSNISSAARGSGNGGNIDIDTTLIVAQPLEDSNIIADAFRGQGGNINISAEGIFGVQSRSEQTRLSDITASSELGIDGTVDLNTPDVDPAQSLVTLPVDTVDASSQIAAGCTNSNTSVANNKFTVTGRGGLPPNPGNALDGDAILTNWATLGETEGENISRRATTTSIAENLPTQQIVEAQGWIVDTNGKVFLTAEAPKVTPNTNKLNTTSCNGS